MNRIILLGRLTADPQLRYTNSDTPCAVCRYTLAVNRKVKRENEPAADFINCVGFGKTGEFGAKYFKKGLLICVSGRLQNYSFTDKQGQKRVMAEVVVDEQDFAESKKSAEMRNDAQVEELMNELANIDDSELPF